MHERKKDLWQNTPLYKIFSRYKTLHTGFVDVEYIIKLAPFTYLCFFKILNTYLSICWPRTFNRCLDLAQLSVHALFSFHSFTWKAVLYSRENMLERIIKVEHKSLQFNKRNTCLTSCFYLPLFDTFRCDRRTWTNIQNILPYFSLVSNKALTRSSFGSLWCQTIFEWFYAVSLF